MIANSGRVRLVDGGNTEHYHSMGPLNFYLMEDPLYPGAVPTGVESSAEMIMAA